MDSFYVYFQPTAHISTHPIKIALQVSACSALCKVFLRQALNCGYELPFVDITKHGWNWMIHFKTYNITRIYKNNIE